MDVEIVESGDITPAQLTAWQQLFEATPDARFYHHPQWHQSIATHLSPAKLHLGFFYSNYRLQMVLPLCNSTGANRRAHPAHDHLSLNDVLIHPQLSNDSEALLSAIYLILSKPGANWWDWRISNVPQHSPFIQALALVEPALLNPDEQTQVKNFQSTCENKSVHWFLKQTRKTASFDCSSDTCPPHGKLRRNLRRLRKQVEEIGKLRVENVFEPEKLFDAYEHFLNVEASGWKSSGDTSTAISANDELKSFYRSLLDTSMPGVTPEINLLWCDDQCIAAQFALRTGSVLSLLKIGYNEDFARFSPGYLLLETVLSEAPNKQIETVSLVTSPPWSERWHPDTAPVWQVNHYNNSAFGVALHQFDRLKQAAKNRLKQAA